MARRTKELSDKTRQAILDAAFEIFARKGFTRTCLQDVALAAGVTRGAIYWHFRDKVDLFMALSEKIEAEAATRPEDIEREQVPSLEVAREKILRYLAHFETRDRYAVFYEMVNYRTEYTAKLQPILDRQISNRRRVLRAFEGILERLRSEGRVSLDINPARGALSLMAFLTGIIAMWVFDPHAFGGITLPAILDEYLGTLGPKSSG